MLITADYLRLQGILQKMVEFNQITAQDREALLNKSGLIKLKDNRWKESSGAILEFGAKSTNDAV
jgi:hypothetical protein